MRNPLKIYLMGVFFSALGYEMKIGPNGDAERNYALLALCQKSYVDGLWRQTNCVKGNGNVQISGLCHVASFGGNRTTMEVC